MYSFDVDKGVFSTHFGIIIVNMISQSFWYPWGNCYASKQQVCSHVSCCQVLVFASLWFHSFFYIYMEKGKIVYNFKKTFQTEKAFPNIQSLSARQVKEAWVYNEETCDTSISKTIISSWIIFSSPTDAYVHLVPGEDVYFSQR